MPNMKLSHLRLVVWMIADQVFPDDVIVTSLKQLLTHTAQLEYNQDRGLT